MNILPLPICGSVEVSLKKFLTDEQLYDSNRRYCAVCGTDRDTLKETHVISFPDVLFISLKRFSCVNGRPSKIEEIVNCNKELSLNIQEEEVLFSVRYKLVAQICHSGQFTQGHYWCNSLRNGK